MEARLLDRSLRRYRTLDTSSVEESHAVLAREICPHALVPVAPGHLRTRHDRLRLHASSLHHISYGAPVRIADAYVDDDFLLLIPSGGASGVVLDGRQIPVKSGAGVILAPGSRFDVTGDAAARTLIWRMPAPPLRDAAAGRLDSAALSFASAPAMSFLRTLHFAIAEARTWEGLPDEDEPRRRIEELLIFAFLRAHRGTSEGSIAPACIRRVEELIAARAHEELTMDDLVAAGGVSERSLHRAFRRFRGETPMAHLRGTRLRRVRADLLDPDAKDSVTVVQARWGVTEFGRFAALYRRAYGELPSATLRAARRSVQPCRKRQ